MAPRAPKSSITQGGRTIYLTNKELLAEIIISKQKGHMTEMLAKMLQLLCSKYAKKGNLIGYSYNEDMQAYAMMMLVRTWASFNPEKGSNPFAFYTQCIKNSFNQQLNQEKKQRDVRDALLVNQGLNPSFGYGDDDNPRGLDDEQDFDVIRSQADKLANMRFIDTPIERDDKGVEIAPVHVEEPDDQPAPEEPVAEPEDPQQ